MSEEEKRVRTIAINIYSKLMYFEELMDVGIRINDIEGLKNDVHYPLIRLLGDWPSEITDITRKYSSCYLAIEALDGIYFAFREPSNIKRVAKMEESQVFYDENIDGCEKELGMKK